MLHHILTRNKYASCSHNFQRCWNIQVFLVDADARSTLLSEIIIALFLALRYRGMSHTPLKQFSFKLHGNVVFRKTLIDIVLDTKCIETWYQTTVLSMNAQIYIYSELK